MGAEKPISAPENTKFTGKMQRLLTKKNRIKKKSYNAKYFKSYEIHGKVCKELERLN